MLSPAPAVGAAPTPLTTEAGTRRRARSAVQLFMYETVSMATIQVPGNFIKIGA